MEQREIELTLTRSEALVLFEMLARIDGSEPLPFADHAEQQVVWRLEGQLEKSLPELLEPNYQDLVAAARRAVRST